MKPGLASLLPQLDPAHIAAAVEQNSFQLPATTKQSSRLEHIKKSKVGEGRGYPAKHQHLHRTSLIHGPEISWHLSILQPQRAVCRGLCVRTRSGARPFPGHVCWATAGAKFTAVASSDGSPHKWSKTKQTRLGRGLKLNCEMRYNVTCFGW